MDDLNTIRALFFLKDNHYGKFNTMFMYDDYIYSPKIEVVMGDGSLGDRL